MRILQLDLTAFGPFTNKTLDLSEGRFGLHVVYGPNEAGKSSMLRALTQVLYGIEVRTSDNFRFEYSNLKLGATLADHLGNPPLSFIRLKRNKEPLRTLENEVLSEKTLEPFLGHINKDTFVRQFGLNWQNLVDGGQEMIRSEGELGRILFAAGSGLTVFSKVRDDIKKEMDELYLASGKNPKINDLLQKYQTAEEVLRQVRVSSQEWKRHHDAYQVAKDREQALKEEKHKLERNLKRLERIHNAKRSIQKFRETQRELATLQDIMILPPDFAKRRQTVSNQLLETRTSRKTLQQDIADLADQIQNLSVNHPVLDRAEEIESLYMEIKHYRESVKDCPTQDAIREAAEADARDLLKSLRPGFPLEQVEDLRIPAADCKRIREMAPEYNFLLESEKSTAQLVIEAKQQLAQLFTDQQNQAKVPDLEALRSAVRRATLLGPLEEEREKKRRAIEGLERQINIQCERLYFWSGPLEDLERIKVPPRKTLSQFQSRFDETNHKLQELHKEHTREQASLEETLRELEYLELEGEVPTEEDLTAARQLRERGWQLICKCWRDGGDSETDLKQFLDQIDASDLESGFQKAVAKADAMSDQLRKEAGRVNEKKRLMASRKKKDANLPELALLLEAQQQVLAATEREWRELWATSRINPGTPSEMLEWREDYNELKNQLKELNANRGDGKQLGDLIEKHRRQLIVCLQQVCPEITYPSEKTLRDLIDHSETVLEEMSERQNQQIRLADSIHRIEKSLPKLKLDAQTASENLSEWRKKWAKLMTLLKRHDETTPGQATEILDRLDTLFKRLRDQSEAAIRVRAMQNVNRTFEERVQSLVDALQWDAKDSSPTQIVTQLHHELARAAETDQKLRDLEKRRSRQDEDFKLCERQIKQLQEELKHLCAEAGCEDPDDLPHAENQSARRQELEKLKQETQEQILDFASDATFEDFLQEADAENPDVLSTKLSDLEQQIVEVEADRANQQELALTERQHRDQLSGGDQAARAAEEKQAILAEIGTHLERYVQLRLTLEALREGAERYRKKHQGPVLARASELFSKLTCGSFLRLQNDGDDQGKPHLVGVRLHEGMEESVEVKGMSDGTADQLYLALRIASLEDWLDHHPRVPFIVDDILINFDDQRAIAALQVLAELSQRTQVIFFTHHLHLVELTETHLPGDVCFHHHLGQTNPQRKKKPQPAKDPGAATLF